LLKPSPGVRRRLSLLGEAEPAFMREMKDLIESPGDVISAFRRR
jgi:hypothetical protein